MMTVVDGLFAFVLFIVRNVIADPNHYNFYYTQMSPPRLECGSDGIRLHLNPTGTFGGHVYVRGFFPQTVCHLNYCTRLTNQPIVMDVPFRGPCNVRRRRNVAPPSISYDVTVIIQHHPLFVTSFDKAYRLNCIYRQKESVLQQRINVSEIPSTAIQSKNAPSCQYTVLSGSLNGPVVRFANVGDIVVHKWTCDSDRYGFVVHSCVVRDESGKDFQYIDERGCVTDLTLFPEVTYSRDLKSAFTSVRAFRYADQNMIHFSCQITTCQKQENGCEGISPPICRPMDLGPIKVHYVNHEKKEKPENTDRLSNAVETLPPRIESSSKGTSAVRPTTSGFRGEAVTTTTESTTTANASQSKASQREEKNSPFSSISINSSSKNQNSNGYNFPNVESGEGVGQDNTAEFGVKRTSSDNGIDEYGLEIVKESDRTNDKKGINQIVAEPEKLTKKDVFHVETISKTMETELEPLPYPTKSTVYQHRSPRSHKGKLDNINITLEVETPKIVILENDTSEEKSKIREFEASEHMKCVHRDDSISRTLILAALVVLQIISILALITQRFYYKKLLDKLSYADDRPGSRRVGF